MTARQIRVQIAQMILQIPQRVALSQIIGVLLKITEPEPAVLPVNIPKPFHGLKLALRRRPGKDIVFAVGNGKLPETLALLQQSLNSSNEGVSVRHFGPEHFEDATAGGQFDGSRVSDLRVEAS